MEGEVNSEVVLPEWGVDEIAAPVNSAVTAWHADWFAELKAADMTCVVSFSQELVNPPAAWIQRFVDQTPVTTATGFGVLSSSQCNFDAAVTGYLGSAYDAMAGLMSAAGLPVWLQFGEVGWWFYAKPGVGMAYYDASTTAALGRPVGSFMTPGDDPALHAADAEFLRSLLHGHMHAIATAVKGAHAGAKLEWLLPLDVNNPTAYQDPGYPYLQGGRLNNFVNIPVQYMGPNGDIDRLKIEALSWGAAYRNLDWAKAAMAYGSSVLTYPVADTAYMVPWFNAGCAWPGEYLASRNARTPLICFWAWDHLCLLNWKLPLPVNAARASIF